MDSGVTSQYSSSFKYSNSSSSVNERVFRIVAVWSFFAVRLFFIFFSFHCDLKFSCAVGWILVLLRNTRHHLNTPLLPQVSTNVFSGLLPSGLSLPSEYLSDVFLW